MPERYTDDGDIGEVTYESDRHRIEELVRAALADEGLAAIDVVCIDGEVTLAGTVIAAGRDTAVKTAKGVLGVRDVVDRLQVGPA